MSKEVITKDKAIKKTLQSLVLASHSDMTEDLHSQRLPEASLNNRLTVESCRGFVPQMGMPILPPPYKFFDKFFDSVGKELVWPFKRYLLPP